MGERSLQQRNKNEKIKIMPGKRKKKKEDRMFGRKKENKKTGLFKKESASQEKSNLLGENPVANREKETVVMKKGHRAGIMRHMKGFAKYDHDYRMTGRAYDEKEAYNKNLSPSARLHYLENERHDADISKKGRRKNKKGGMFGGKFRTSDGRVEGSPKPTKSRG